MVFRGEIVDFVYFWTSSRPDSVQTPSGHCLAMIRDTQRTRSTPGTIPSLWISFGAILGAILDQNPNFELKYLENEEMRKWKKLI